MLKSTRLLLYLIIWIHRDLYHDLPPTHPTPPHNGGSEGGGGSSVVRAADSWLKGRGFESRRENFLLRGRHFVLTLISVSVPPPVIPGYIPTPNASHIHGSSLLLPPATSRVHPCPKQHPRSTPTPAISTPIPAISTPTPATSRVHPYLTPATSRAHPSIPTSRSLYPGPHLPSHCSRHVCFTACPVPVVILCGVVDVYRDCLVFLTASEERSDPSA